MVINDFLSPADARVDVETSDKNHLLRDLSGHAASALGLASGAIASELLKREALGSTGIGGGVAIPHARVADLKKPYGTVVRLAQPIEFNSVDEQPVDIVFLLLLPATMEAEHLNALACVARKLRDPTAILEVRQAADASALHHALTT